MTCTSVSPEVIQELQKYDSPTIINVIELFQIQPCNSGYMNASIKSIFPEFPPVVGYASPATFRGAIAPAQAETNSSFLAHIEALSLLPQPRIVVFEDLDSPSKAATFGEVMCAIYQRFGCVGIVTSGAARDILAIRKLGFAVFASSTCVSHGYSRIEDMHQTVHVGGLTIRTGDLLHADANGIVLIPHSIADSVARACPLYIEAERIVLEFLRSETVSLEGLRQAFDEHVQKILSIPGMVRGAADVIRKRSPVAKLI
ncbi:MAG TPA: RraA family protein [Acidobacteriota bacterium]|jgi:regulator of RNase E activity RraA